MSIVPTAFLFRYTLPVQRVDRLPRAKAPLLALPESCRVPWPSQLDDPQQFAELSLAWNPQGLAVQVTVTGSQEAPIGLPETANPYDAVLVWIDTRDTQTLHRGTRFCHHFGAIPTGGGKAGDEPVMKQVSVPRAREEAPAADPDSFLVEADVRPDGYRLSLWFSADALHGFDPATQPRLGFYITVHARHQGKQVLSVPDDFPYEADPSQWVSLELKDV
ncbi:hypothetical protein [Planctomicrobium sp. SH664]|uniref:hypothetical protein n=1 Tax=Planctomicrobium sp. SH664 TaxID=3448125 RepID=UPI003F5B4B37